MFICRLYNSNLILNAVILSVNLKTISIAFKETYWVHLTGKSLKVAFKFIFKHAWRFAEALFDLRSNNKAYVKFDKTNLFHFWISNKMSSKPLKISHEEAIKLLSFVITYLFGQGFLTLINKKKRTVIKWTLKSLFEVFLYEKASKRKCNKIIFSKK